MGKLEKGRFSKILVAIDGSDLSMSAADIALAMAKKDNSKLVALNILHIPFADLYLANSKEFREFIRKGKQVPEEWFDIIRKKAAENKVELRTECIDEIISVPAAIVDYAEREKVDLIIIGTRGRGGFKRLLLGSVAQDVVKYAACPVMVIR